MQNPRRKKHLDSPSSNLISFTQKLRNFPFTNDALNQLKAFKSKTKNQQKSSIHKSYHLIKRKCCQQKQNSTSMFDKPISEAKNKKIHHSSLIKDKIDSSQKSFHKKQNKRKELQNELQILFDRKNQSQKPKNQQNDHTHQDDIKQLKCNVKEMKEMLGILKTKQNGSHCFHQTCKPKENHQNFEEMAEMKRKLQSIEQQRHNLRAELKSYELKMKSYEETSSKLKEEFLSNLQQKNNYILQLEKDIDQLREEKKNLKKQLYDQATEIQNFKGSHRDQTQQLRQINQKYLRQLTEQKSITDASINNANQIIQQNQEDISILKQELIKLEETNQQFARQIKAQQNQINDKQAEVCRIQQQNEEIITELKQVIKNHQAKQSENIISKQNLDAQTLSLRKGKEQIQIKYLELKTVYLQKNAEIIQIQQKLDESSFKNQQIELKNDALQGQIQIKSKQLAQKSKKLEESLKQLNKIRQQNQQTQKLFNQYKTQIGSIDQRIESNLLKFKTIRDQFEKLTLNLSQVMQEEDNLMKLISESEQNLLKCQRQSAAFKQQISQEIRNKDRIINELKHVITQIREETIVIKSQLHEYKTEALKNQQQIARLEQESQSLRNTLFSYSNNKSDLIIENLTLRESIKKQTKQKQEHQWKITELEEQIQNINEHGLAKQHTILKLQKQTYNSNIRILELEKENTELETKLNSKEEKIDHQLQQSIQKVKSELRTKIQEYEILTKKSSEFEEKYQLSHQSYIKIKNELHQTKNKQSYLIAQKANLTQQNQKLKQQISMIIGKLNDLQRDKLKQTEKVKEIQIKSQEQLNEIFDICEVKKNEIVQSLKNKIRQLAEQLTVLIAKLQTKNVELNICESKIQSLQQLLQENHQLLNQEKAERQKANSEIDNLKTTLKHKCLIIAELQKEEIRLKQRAHLMQKQQTHRSIEMENIMVTNRKNQKEIAIKNQKMRRMENQISNLELEVENQKITLKILKQENANIEKVMGEQIQQRKDIIEQLMNQKKILYSQICNE